jgi:hypothetical protein
MKAGFLLLALSILPGLFAGARADSPVPMDGDQTKIAECVTDQLIARIVALKPQYPQLAKFGDAPEFVRLPGGFRYDYRVERIPAAKGETLRERPLPGGCFLYFRILSGSDMAGVFVPPKELSDYVTGFSEGGERTGITHLFRFSLFRKPNQDSYDNPSTTRSGRKSTPLSPG